LIFPLEISKFDVENLNARLTLEIRFDVLFVEPDDRTSQYQFRLRVIAAR